MHMRPGGTAGGAGFGDYVAALHQITGLDQQLGSVGVAGGEVVAVVDIDHVAILSMNFGNNDQAAGRRVNGCTGVDQKIDALVHGVLSGNRIDAPAEAGGIPMDVDRFDRGHELFFHLGVEQLVFEDTHVVVTVFHMLGKRVELPGEIVHGQVLHRDGGGQRAAATRGLAHAELLRFDARERRQALAQRIQAHQLRLHLAQPDRHRVQILAHEVLGIPGLLFLRRQQQRLHQRQFDLGRMAKYQIEQGTGQGHDGGRQQRHPQQHVPGAERNRFGRCQPVRYENNMHDPLREIAPCIPRIFAPTWTRPRE